MPYPKEDPERAAFEEEMYGVFVYGTVDPSTIPPARLQLLTDAFRFSATRYPSHGPSKVELTKDTMDAI